MNLKGKVVIVTGAKSGIGLATAVLFADEGARVVVADVREASQEVSELAKRGAEGNPSRVKYIEDKRLKD